LVKVQLGPSVLGTTPFSTGLVSLTEKIKVGKRQCARVTGRALKKKMPHFTDQRIPNQPVHGKKSARGLKRAESAMVDARGKVGVFRKEKKKEGENDVITKK